MNELRPLVRMKNRSRFHSNLALHHWMQVAATLYVVTLGSQTGTRHRGTDRTRTTELTNVNATEKAKGLMTAVGHNKLETWVEKIAQPFRRVRRGALQ